MTIPGYGTFGNLGRDYQAARQKFPDTIIDFFTGKVSSGSQVIDLGCGTGIATRQLAGRGYRMTGTDIDENMILIAREASEDITYAVAPATTLSFPDAHFDAATAFSAFHWFSDLASVAEIKRVLKPDTLFMVVNKNDIAGFKVGYRDVLAPFIETSLPNAKQTYIPEQTLDENGFTDIERHVFPVTETHSLDEALAYLRSVSLWNLVPETCKEEAQDAVREFCERELRDGLLTRLIDVAVVLGRR